MFLLIAIFLISFFSFKLNRHFKKMRSMQEKNSRLSSLSLHYVYCFIIWSIIFVASITLLSSNDKEKILLTIFFILSNFFLIKLFYRKKFNAKNHIDFIIVSTIATTAAIGILITISITISILFEALKFFEIVKISDFIFGINWNPQMAINAEQSVSKGSFGIIPVLLGTILITLIAISIAIPLGIMAAIYLVFYANSKTRDYLKPILEILAGVPTVVYGYFAVIAVAPFFKNIFTLLGFNIASESALAAGMVMGIMIVPFILSLTDDTLNAAPQSLKDGALALGSTKSEMIKKVILPFAMPSIVGAIILAVSRAIGETMIVTMAAGLVAKMTFNPLESVTTATAQIVTLLVGDQEFNSPKTLAAFALALVLFIITFVFNMIALITTKRFSK